MKQEESRDPGELHYHYDRAVRRAGLPERLRQTRPKGFLRGNRSLVITLLDLSVLLILFVIVWFFVRSGGRGDALEGYELAARGVVFGDRVFASLSLEPQNEEVSGGIVSAAFGFDAGAAEVTVTDVLPEPGEEARVLRTSIPLDPEAKQIVILVRIGEEIKEVTADLEPE